MNCNSILAIGFTEDLQAWPIVLLILAVILVASYVAKLLGGSGNPPAN